ncbi:MAG: hypothetical protein P8L85_12015 [Rubripirellula sp.]|nr:hypothetical protein [Rubripirellula sp.]
MNLNDQASKLIQDMGDATPGSGDAVSERTVSNVDVSNVDSLTAGTLGFRAYRAPRRHGESLIEPSFDSAAALIRSNRSLLQHQPFPDAGLRGRARRKLIDDALQYTATYRSVDWVDAESLEEGLPPILMAGHQPALFHPGVWYKNFTLSRLAKQNQALAINLVIDNDVASGCSVRVPTVDRANGSAGYRAVPYDEGGGGVPYEQTTIHDRELFDHFDRQVKDAIAPLVKNPCITEMWHHALHAVERCGIAGCALAQARHGLEGQLGLQTLELPMGAVCRTPEFAAFALSILTELPRFHRCYNDAANHYRHAHGIRSSAHPVPNLAEDGEWFEAPMWLYGDDAPQRKPVWAKLSDDHLVLSDRDQREQRIDIRFPQLAAEQLSSLASPDFKLRPRALLTTMYARLVLSDLFLHGIGGGKYDQLNDLIIQSFFMIQPPQFMVVSATLRLPGIEAVSGESVSGETAIRALKRAIRETIFQAERFEQQVELNPAQVSRKRELLAEIPPPGRRQAWHDEMTQLNESLSRQTRVIREKLRSELAEAEKRATTATMLAGREHPFCLFPLEYLQQSYDSMLEGESETP